MLMNLLVPWTVSIALAISGAATPAHKAVDAGKAKVAAKADKSCCTAGAACCSDGAACCSDCCYPGSPCCYPGSPCCGHTAKVAKVAVQPAKK
jgi:hypothetical protein